MSQCPWTIRYGTTAETTTRCAREEHVGHVVITSRPDGKFTVDIMGDGRTRGDTEHKGPGLMPGQRITWEAGDRREYQGDWPGQCEWSDGRGQCVLPVGHHGRHAP